MGARHSVVTPKPPRGAWVPGCPRSWSGAEDRSEPIEMGERGPEKPGREIPGSPGNRGAPPSSLRWGYPGVRISWGGVGCMGAEGPSSIWNHSSQAAVKGLDTAPDRRRSESRGPSDIRRKHEENRTRAGGD